VPVWTTTPRRDTLHTRIEVSAMPPLTLLRCAGGDLVLPDRAALLASRLDGGNLVVHPPRPVWERSELRPDELTAWTFLVAAAGRAMIDTLPQLVGGCVNYWEAGNWALNDAAEPTGRKTAREHRRMHLHLLGRSPASRRPGWRWGESPIFPAFAERHTWAQGFERLTAEECRQVVAATCETLRDRYAVPAPDLAPWAACRGCGFPVVLEPAAAIEPLCVECAP
jgi:hypothetical protein